MRLILFLTLTSTSGLLLAQNPSTEQLAKWLKRFLEADGNRDGLNDK